MSEKKKKHNAKLPQKLQPPNPKSGFFVPNSGFLCVPNLLCSILEEDLCENLDCFLLKQTNFRLVK